MTSEELASLRRLTERAVYKLELEQERDCNCVWHEFETLILWLEDYFKEQNTKK
jgi:hypothetical protein